MNAVKTAGGFLGLGGGPDGPAVQSGNSALSQLNNENSFGGSGDGYIQALMNNYGSGNASAGDVQSAAQKHFGNTDHTGAAMQGLNDALATGSTTGSRYATDQVMSNPILGSLFGHDGQLGKATGQLDKLNSQGYELQPEDMTMYGQVGGNIARMFGQQGNQMSQDLASRGLASAPSGAAGAMFSGLAGNQNEQLSHTMQNLMQQRFQNTMQQTNQLQNYISQLGNQGQNAIQSQYGRQLSGAQHHTGSLQNTANLQNSANKDTNTANMAAANFEQENKPENFMDAGVMGANTAMGAGGKTVGEKGGAKLSNSMFGES